MGFAVAYKTTAKLSPALQAGMIDATHELTSGRTWLSCEPPFLVNVDGALFDASKPNFSPHPDDIASATSEGLPDGTLNDLIDVLCKLSGRFDVDWEISHDHSDGPVGYIRNGVCDDEVRIQCAALSDLANELGGENFDLEDF